MTTLNKVPEGLTLATEAHVKYIQSLDTRKDELDYWLTEHLRLNGLYWGLTALHLLRRPDALPRQEVIDFVLSCQHENGGFGAAPGHDAHMLSTVSAVQILAMTDAFDQLESKGTGKSQIGKCRYLTRSAVLLRRPLMKRSHCRLAEPRDWHLCWG